MQNFKHRLRRNISRSWVWLKTVVTLERRHPVRRFDQDALERFESEGGGVVYPPLPSGHKSLNHPVRKSA